MAHFEPPPGHLGLHSQEMRKHASGDTMRQDALAARPAPMSIDNATAN